MDVKRPEQQCIFCGDKQTLDIVKSLAKFPEDDYWIVRCVECHSEARPGRTAEEAIQHWDDWQKDQKRDNERLFGNKKVMAPPLA